MASKLRPAQERLFDLLSRKTAGDHLTEREILQTTLWKPATLKTYHRKHVLDPFLLRMDHGQFRALRDGSSISKADLASAFTQVRSKSLVLAKGMRLSGSSGDYELLRYVGEGAVAHVWEARRQDDRTKYAAKIMNPRPDLLEPTILQNVSKRFSREAKNGMKLNHPNVVPYRDFGDVGGHPFLVMDLADEPLSRALKEGALSLDRSLPIIQACLSGLDYLHRAGCVHRDVKPPNVLRFGDRFVLGDLGIVRWSDMNRAFTTAGTVTRASVQLGSWYYMAPEQRRSPHQATALSDVYALGVTWYEILKGEAPEPDVIAAKRFPDPSSDSRANDMIHRMLEFDVGARPSVQDLLDEVGAVAKAAGSS